METLPRVLSLPFPNTEPKLRSLPCRAHVAPPLTCGASIVRLPRGRRICAIDGGLSGADMAPVEITWQIAIGALAGISPFVVAGVEFGKRIVEQKKCEVCGGSGLVLKDKIYMRCQGCGGFLPWQSWKRFFSG